MGRVTVFSQDESGAVSVDWVILTAGVVGLAVTACALAESGLLGLGAKVVAMLVGTSV